MSEQTVPLSQAQRAEVQALNNEVLQAQAALMRFVEYLYREHDLSPDEWRLENYNVGFVRTPGPAPRNGAGPNPYARPETVIEEAAPFA